MLQKVVNTVDTDGNELELLVNKPTAKQNSDSQIIYSREWLKAEQNGCPLKITIDEIAEKRGLWTEEDENKLKNIDKSINDTEKKLRAGSKFYKTLDKARIAAINIKKWRTERLVLLNKKSVLGEHTAESYAERARTNYLISVSVVYSNNGKQYFRDMNDYLERSEEKASLDVTQAFIELVYSDLFDYDKKNYENQFLLKYGFVDDQFRLINKDGKLIDYDGHLIDENGRFVNENGVFVDIDGNEVDEDGNYVIEFVPFD